MSLCSLKGAAAGSTSIEGVGYSLASSVSARPPSALEIMQSISREGIRAPMYRASTHYTSATSASDISALCVNVVNLTKPGCSGAKGISQDDLRALTEDEWIDRILILGLGIRPPSIAELLDVSGSRHVIKDLRFFIQALVSEASTGMHPVSAERQERLVWARNESILKHAMLKRVQRSFAFVFKPDALLVDDAYTMLKSISVLDKKGTWPSHVEVRSQRGIVLAENILRVLVPVELLPQARFCFPEHKIVPVLDTEADVHICNLPGLFEPCLGDKFPAMNLVAPDYEKALARVIVEDPDLKLLGTHVMRADISDSVLNEVKLELPQSYETAVATMGAQLTALEVGYSLVAREADRCELTLDKSTIETVLGTDSAGKPHRIRHLLEINLLRAAFDTHKLAALYFFQQSPEYAVLKVREICNTFEVYCHKSNIAAAQAMYKASGSAQDKK